MELDRKEDPVCTRRIQNGGHCQSCCDSQHSDRKYFTESSCVREGKMALCRTSWYRCPGTVAVMYWFSALLLTCHIGMGVTQDIPLKVELEPGEIGPEKVDVRLTCTYTVDSPLTYLHWGGSKKMYTYKKAKGELHDGYRDRLTEWGDISNKSHHMVLRKVDWCEDLQTYTCQVYDTPISEDIPADQGQGGKELKAKTGDCKTLLDDENFTDHTSLEKPRNVTVSCSAYYNNNASAAVYLEIVFDEKITKYVNGPSVPNGDSCNHVANAEETFPVDTQVRVTCINEVNGENITCLDNKMIAVGNVDEYLAAGGEGGHCGPGCIGGIVGGAVALIVIAIVVYVFLKKSKKKKVPTATLR